MNDAFAEFLTENAQRRYPFIEDSSLTALDLSVIEDSVVLDFKAFHRAKPATPPRLKIIVGPDAAGIPPYDPVPGGIAFYFQAGPDEAPMIWQFVVPLAGADFPLHMRASVPDPTYPGVNMGVASAMFGPAAALIDPASFLEFTDAILEPSLVVESYRAQVDSIKIVHDEGDDEYLSGDVSIEGGYNVAVTPIDNGVRVSPSPGAGNLGRFVASIKEPGDSKCSGILLSINGRGPSPAGELFIEGGAGIEIVNLPDQHKVRVKVSPSRIGETLCA